MTKNLIFIFLYFFALTNYGQKYHSYEFAEVPYQEYNGQMIVPTRADMSANQIKKTDVQFKFYNDNTCNIVFQGKKSECTYSIKNNLFIVDINGTPFVFDIKKNPEIKDEYIIFNYKYTSKLEGKIIAVYFCQLLK